MRFVPAAGSRYNGIFEGSDHGLIRYSVAKDYDDKKWGADSSFMPGISLKFFRDGTHSANLMALQSFIATETPDFFQYDFKNHIDENTVVSASVKLISKLFSKGSKWALTLGLKDWAASNQAGQMT